MRRTILGGNRKPTMTTSSRKVIIALLLLARGDETLAFRAWRPCTETRPRSTTHTPVHHSFPLPLALKAQKVDDDFWARQKELASEMTNSNARSVKIEQKQKFKDLQLALVRDTAFMAFYIFWALWFSFDNPFVAFSYTLGATLGLAYVYGLGKYVESVGGSIDDIGEAPGAGVGQARFAFLILLVVLVGKLRTVGFFEIPAISGFFTYQLASLSQGLQERRD